MINIYCDESCHLQNDGNDIMVLGGIYCQAKLSSKINKEIIEIKKEFGFSPYMEIKWNKISPSAEDFYLALIDYFFENPALRFRGYVARGKSEIKDELFQVQYYKLYYRMLEFIIDQDKEAIYSFYVDKKDTIGNAKITTLKEYLNNHYKNETVEKAQLVDSSDIALLQLADLLIGALSYKHRRLTTSETKLKLINQIEKLSGFDLLTSVNYKETKANWFIWVPDSWR